MLCGRQHNAKDMGRSARSVRAAKHQEHVLLSFLFLSFFALGIAGLPSCKKKMEEFDINKKWTVQAVSKQGTAVPNSTMLGDTYDFHDGQCAITSTTLGSKTVRFIFSQAERKLQLGREVYEVYRTEVHELQIGHVLPTSLQGADNYTLTLRQ